jgi:hypothetical protein
LPVAPGSIAWALQLRAATRGDAKPLVSMRDRLQNRWIRTTYTEAARHGKIDKTGRESETT